MEHMDFESIVFNRRNFHNLDVLAEMRGINREYKTFADKEIDERISKLNSVEDLSRALSLNKNRYIKTKLSDKLCEIYSDYGGNHCEYGIKHIIRFISNVNKATVSDYEIDIPGDSEFYFSVNYTVTLEQFLYDIRMYYSNTTFDTLTIRRKKMINGVWSTKLIESEIDNISLLDTKQYEWLNGILVTKIGVGADEAAAEYMAEAQGF